ncbi:MAG: hypothetical protein LBV72_13250 [Tannerella sp.]|jgi:hypothetical protein|nr:hypothetical protein [Tannerella sp.]
MKNIIYSLLSIALFYVFTSCSDEHSITDEPDHPNGEKAFNANQKVPAYDGFFLYGSNMAYKNNNWSDQDVADILAGNTSKGIEGVGVNSLRPALYENFVEQYGYEIRLDAFKHYKNIGAINNTVFIGDRPSDAHREKKRYVNGEESESYENLYEAIWDNGENGTPVNDNNYYALYVYKVAQMYGENVRFWEIKNEPDYTHTGYGNRASGEEGNWWDNNPNPTDLKNWKAPIQNYVRLLRVSYEVIKYVNPDAYVCVGGIGYASFLDAILRNTDNPDNGRVTDEYPLTGGAWFDCLSYHVYPMYYLRNWVGKETAGNINGFGYFRNSDDAVKNVIEKKNDLFDLMKKYGYDGATYPMKEVIITETNIPNKQTNDYIGSQQAQRNFAIKLAVQSQINEICGVYIYCPWDNKENSNSSTDPYDYMGFYKPIPESPNSNLRVNDIGTAWRTMTGLLSNSTYDAGQTSRLNLPTEINGAAFYSKQSKDYLYVLWVSNADKDQNENASANYSFPSGMNVSKIYTRQWDNKSAQTNGSTLKLTGAPVFVKVNKDF